MLCSSWVPGHKGLSWLTATDKEKGISQLRTEKLNVARAPLSDGVVDKVAEPPPQKSAKSSVFEEAK